MHQNIQRLYQIANKPSRKIIGLMSGTSMDGLDIALCDITGAGLATKVNVLQFTTLPYDEFMKEQILSVFSKEMVSLEKLTLLNAWIASEHAQMVNTTLAGWGISADAIDLIASHGQTIYHAPKSLHPNDVFGNATLQIGDGDHIAVQTGIITLSDFRQKHIAAGGAGAPLALYGDYLLCGDAQENRLLLNMGGISNYTYLPANATLEMVCSTDTGPGNTIMDAYMRLYYNQAYDKDGFVAQQGRANTHLLNKLLEDTFFSLHIPKTIGPELFNIEYVQKAICACGVDGISIPDIMATLALFTATTIVDTIYKLVPANENFTIYTSGGGMHNPVIMQHLKNLMPTIQILSSEIIGIDPNAKEAILFAVLANEAVAGEAMYAGNNATKVPVSMGKISFPH
jgi:anhydro-N-acetylmuramic acid kinase